MLLVPDFRVELYELSLEFPIRLSKGIYSWYEALLILEYLLRLQQLILDIVEVHIFINEYLLQILFLFLGFLQFKLVMSLHLSVLFPQTLDNSLCGAFGCLR